MVRPVLVRQPSNQVAGDFHSTIKHIFPEHLCARYVLGPGDAPYFSSSGVTWQFVSQVGYKLLEMMIGSSVDTSTVPKPSAEHILGAQ